MEDLDRATPRGAPGRPRCGTAGTGSYAVAVRASSIPLVVRSDYADGPQGGWRRGLGVRLEPGVPALPALQAPGHGEMCCGPSDAA